MVDENVIFLCYNQFVQLIIYIIYLTDTNNNGIIKKIIAVYNTLLTLDKPQDIRDIALEFENDGKMLGGEFGTNPYAAERYFKRYDYKVETVKGEDITEKEPPKADAYILSYWNTNDVLDGIHTIAINKNKKDEYVFYNDDVRDEKEVPVSTIKKRVGIEGYQPIIMLCISKK